ncbi:hypothetical protein [Sphingomicrobium lutaoense]|uniref:Peptidase M1 membrane alanine aminopeptidase domain-containing protein n=1 Tax=Sphingomicrobium lutaoense TaxID=515949 RepID=A0A839YWH7_9SPHN|nr:hypothetical protein [Sphingomicrobium lutaoense]MBB3764561.1 hypothetical protein [Sphingomicrobium lutaoense]
MVVRRVLALALAAAAIAAPAGAGDVRAAPTMTARVAPQSVGELLVTFEFDEPAPLFIFQRSGVVRGTGESWRVGHWKVETPGVALRRIGLHDALVATRGNRLPREVKVRMTPFTGLLTAEYTPVVRFTDGTMAIFSDHFAMRPAPTVEAVRALGADINALPNYRGGNALVRFEASDLPLHHRGRERRSVRLETPAYVLVGDVEAGGSEDIATVIDPGLPRWLARQLTEEVPEIMALYRRRLGERSGERPELIVAWNGAPKQRVSLGGSVVGDTIVMQIEGAMLKTPSPTAYGYARQFIAHEAAHFWLGNTVGYGPPGEAWTTEGGADLIAQRVAEMIDPGHDSRPVIEQAIEDCARLSADGALRTAPERHGQDVFYACGAVFTLAAEAVEKKRGGDLFTFWSRLLEENREDGTVSVADWLGAMRKAGGPREAVEIIATMQETGSRDPRARLIQLLAHVGIHVKSDAEGRLRLS